MITTYDDQGVRNNYFYAVGNLLYEQGGGSTAGLAVKTDDGDTLTLTKRAMHHYTTSMSTIEITSKNAESVVSEFKKYFDNNIAGVDMDMKTYVVTSPDENKIQAVKKLLDANKIDYGIVTGENFSGYNYNR